MCVWPTTCILLELNILAYKLVVMNLICLQWQMLGSRTQQPCCVVGITDLLFDLVCVCVAEVRYQSLQA